MIQKTLITNKLEELKEYMCNLKNTPEYKNSSERILLFSDQNDNCQHLKEQVALIQETLPEIKITGTTMPQDNMFFREDTQELRAGFSFLLMDRARMDIMYYDCHTMSVEEAGKNFHRELRYRDHVAGVMIFSAGLEKQIDKFLTACARKERYDIPILGVQAGATNIPYICGSDNLNTPNDCCIVALVFYGRNLHMYYNYDMGWKDIGKEMKITEIDGNYCVKSIDHMPAVSIYHEYLGVEPDQYFVENVREFPFITYRGQHKVVRTPSGYDEDGKLHFIAKINQGDTVKLSYCNPRRLMDETKYYAESMHAFGPQALFLLICENRARFLGDLSASDILVYRNFMPQLAWVRGFSAMLLDAKGGGIVNSAILSVGLREGAPRGDDLDKPQVESEQLPKQGAIPLDQRLAMFLEKTTKELEDMAIAADSANAAKSEFLSQMSHEIRTPINAVLGMNEMILRESKDDHILKYAENARIAGLSLLGIISDILDFSKIEAGKMDIIPYEYELSSTINDLVNLIQHRVEEKGLILSVVVNPDIPHVLFGDELRIKQIVTNLLTNAVKYTEKGSVTMVFDYEKTGMDEIHLLVSVKDTGIGIREENLSKLYTAFDRIDLNQARKIEGTGLGINITQQLLSLMNSKLEVSSTYGVGSVFSFSLMQKVTDWDKIGEYGEAIKKVERKRAEKKTQFTAELAHILVVDDAPMNLEVISSLLRRTLIQIDTVESGEECIQKFGQNSYDLVFLDHRMPHMDGIETLQKMKELYGEDLRGVPVISLTANAIAGAREQYMKAGFSDYLTKPVMADELEAMIQKHLPEDKVLFIAVDNETSSEEPVILPEWLSDIHLLNVEDGIRYCGGTQEYLDALTIFAESISVRAKEIETCYQNQDWINYTIKMHALKSMTKTIGAGPLSELAASLEEAGNHEDLYAIHAGTNVLLTLYRELEPSLSLLSNPLAQITSAGNRESHHILLVDDDSDFLALVSRWLKKDYRVSTINSGEQALKYLQTVHPDLILLDYAMPKMSGLQVLESIRQNPDTQNLPVIFLTGTDDRETVKNAERLNPKGYLLKSIGKAGLIMGIQKYFEQADQ